jgi:KDO2-lipid IV(A) lauroyltransferase
MTDNWSWAAGGLPRRGFVRNTVEVLLVRFALSTLRLLPMPLAYRLGFWYALLLSVVIRRWKPIAIENLRRAALPTGLVQGVFRSLGRVLATVAHLPRLHAGNIRRVIDYEGFEHYEAAKQRGKGVLFATGHLGNWELSSVAHALMTEPMNIVVRPLDNPGLDALFARRRATGGNRVIDRGNFLRQILRALKNNEAVGVLLDQHVADAKAIPVEFFGRPAMADPVFAKLAHASGAAVIPGFAVWRADLGRFVLKFYPAVEMTGDPGADTQAIQGAIERAIREYPDQWLWIHRRWKR